MARPGDFPKETTADLDDPPVRRATVQRFELTVVEGPAAGLGWESTADRCAVGSHQSNDLVLPHPTVSRFHCEVRQDGRGARVRDLGSRNGTIVDGVQLVDGYLRDGSLMRLGKTVLRFQLGRARNRLPLSERTGFGGLVGSSVAMRATFALLERAAAADVTVLLEGETGTGKERAAEAIHAASARAEQPFVVVDASALPRELLESELFGHERGAFTGAHARRIGAFEEAAGGTIFLDEVGELPVDLQPKLLRVLEQREVRRVGGSGYQPVDVRVIAATNRDLRAFVNAGGFRSDLYFRLAVLKVELPPLRARPEDLPLLVEHFLGQLGADAATARALRAPDFVQQLARTAWPGNVRELRNHVEQCIVLRQPMEIESAPAGPAPAIDPALGYEEGRRRAISAYERSYVETILARHGGKVAQAARAAGIGRVHLYRLMRKHGLKP